MVHRPRPLALGTSRTGARKEIALPHRFRFAKFCFITSSSCKCIIAFVPQRDANKIQQENTQDHQNTCLHAEVQIISGELCLDVEPDFSHRYKC